MTMSTTIKVTIWQIAVLLVLSFVFFFHGLNGYSLKEPDEGRYAEIPREMVELHDYVVPHLNYTRYFEKPPLFYWAAALSYKAFGVSEWSFRFPNALAAFLCVMALYFSARRWFNRETAFISSVILMSSLGFFAMARIVTLDMFLSLWLFLSLICFYGYYREKKSLFIYMFYAAMGLATLTKGPVGVALSGATILIFLFWEKKLLFLKEMRWVRGIGIYLLVTLPWILAISLKEKEFLYFFFMDQHILRFFTSKHKRTGSIFYFLPVLFGGMLPWSLFIPRCFATLWTKRELRLFFVWIVVVFGFFTISKSKLPPYILPIFPPLALVLGHLFHEKWKDIKWRPENLLYIIIFAALSCSTLLYQVDAFTSFIGTISREAPRILTGLHAFSIALSAFSIIITILLIFRMFTKFSSLFVLFASFSCFIVIALMANAHLIDRLNTTKHLSSIINEQSPPPQNIVNYAALDLTLPYYTKRPVIIASYKGELEMGSDYDDSRRLFISEENFIKMFSSKERTVAVLKEKKIKRLEAVVGDKLRLLGCRAERCLVANY
jgi:hypothetical protein